MNYTLHYSCQLITRSYQIVKHILQPLFGCRLIDEHFFIIMQLLLDCLYLVNLSSDTKDMYSI